MDVCRLNLSNGVCYSHIYISENKLCGTSETSQNIECFNDLNSFSDDFYILKEGIPHSFISENGISYETFEAHTALAAVLLAFSFVFLSSFLAILLGRR